MMTSKTSEGIDLKYDPILPVSPIKLASKTARSASSESISTFLRKAGSVNALVLLKASRARSGSMMLIYNLLSHTDTASDGSSISTLNLKKKHG
jgi:hypothetical protein